MSTSLQPETPSTSVSGAMSRDSSAPLLSKADEVDDLGEGSSTKMDDNSGKPRMRDFFRFGKKSEEEKKDKTKLAMGTKPPVPPLGGLQPVSPLVANPAASPPRSHPYGSPTSPGRQALRSASPRTHSPASSMIFERNVQEDVPAQASPQIPSHIVTENHIPPALDATSEAITDSKLDPDTVEIVTHAGHQPAAATLSNSIYDQVTGHSAHDALPASFARQDTDNVSNYGSLDVGDVRRLSFISFADVVHAEQEMGDQRRDSAQLSPLSGHPMMAAPRSPSPIRSPISSQAFGTSPSTSITPSMKGQEVSPTRGVKAAGSPLPGTNSPTHIGELNIETMRQALRKTGSGDLSGFRPASNAGIDDTMVERPTR